MCGTEGVYRRLSTAKNYSKVHFLLYIIIPSASKAYNYLKMTYHLLLFLIKTLYQIFIWFKKLKKTL